MGADFLTEDGFFFHRIYGLRDLFLGRILAEMNRILQGLLLSVLMVVSSVPILAEDELQGNYKSPTINRRLFGDDLSMVNNERDEYATNLTAFAVRTIQKQKGSQASLDKARELLGLALHLSPRNRKSLVVNKQLAEGVMPESVAADYESEVFAKLLLARGQLLEKQQGESNALLARYFIALSAAMDPRNEDAVYESEIRRIDHGELSWSMMTDPSSSAGHSP